MLLWAEVVTSYRARTEVERWQIQDRLASRLGHLGRHDRPRFYEASDGRLAFRLRIGWGLTPGLVAALERIDDVVPPTPS